MLLFFLFPFRGAVFYNEESKKWCVVFPGSDASVVRRSQRFMYENNDERPVRLCLSFSPPLVKKKKGYTKLEIPLNVELTLLYPFSGHKHNGL